MDEDTEQAAWHQQELENWQWLLEHDPEYIEWLDSIKPQLQHEKETANDWHQ